MRWAHPALPAPLPLIGHRGLRNNLARVLAETVKQGRTGPITCRTAPAAISCTPGGTRVCAPPR